MSTDDKPVPDNNSLVWTPYYSAFTVCFVVLGISVFANVEMTPAVVIGIGSGLATYVIVWGVMKIRSNATAPSIATATEESAP